MYNWETANSGVCYLAALVTEGAHMDGVTLFIQYSEQPNKPERELRLHKWERRAKLRHVLGVVL